MARVPSTLSPIQHENYEQYKLYEATLFKDSSAPQKPIAHVDCIHA